MYRNPHFEEEDLQKIIAFMEAHSFVTLIGFDGEYPVATQVPVKIEQREDEVYLIGHIMKKTDHHQAYSRNENVLALFTGAHAYVSASVYQDPAVASTWNFQHRVILSLSYLATIAKALFIKVKQSRFQISLFPERVHVQPILRSQLFANSNDKTYLSPIHLIRSKK